MTLDRKIPCPALGQNTVESAGEWADDVQEELGGLWDRASCPLTNVSGTDVLTAQCSPTLEAYVTGMRFVIVPANDNTGAVTLDIDSVGIKDVVRPGGDALEGGDLTAGSEFDLYYNGTALVLMTPSVVSRIPSSVILDEGVVTAQGSLPLNFTEYDDFRQIEILLTELQVAADSAIGCTLSPDGINFATGGSDYNYAISVQNAGNDSFNIRSTANNFISLSGITLDSNANDFTRLQILIPGHANTGQRPFLQFNGVHADNGFVWEWHGAGGRFADQRTLAISIGTGGVTNISCKYVVIGHR